MSDTTYIVLRGVEVAGKEDGGWEYDSERNAASAHDAICQAATEPGTFVAVPARSWKPVTVRTEQKTIIHLDTQETP